MSAFWKRHNDAHAAPRRVGKRADHAANRMRDRFRIRSAGNAPLILVGTVGVLARPAELRPAGHGVHVQPIHAIGRVSTTGSSQGRDFRIDHELDHRHPIRLPHVQGNVHSFR